MLLNYFRVKVNNSGTYAIIYEMDEERENYLLLSIRKS